MFGHKFQLAEIYAKKNFKIGYIKRKGHVDNLEHFTIVFISFVLYKICYYVVNGRNEIFNLNLFHKYFHTIVTKARFFNFEMVVNEITLVNIINKKA